MARGALCAYLLLAGVAASAAAPPPAAPGAPSAAAADIEALQQRLLAAQQVIATLERQLVEERNNAAALTQARLRNGRLVSIARQLIDAYAKRYGNTHRHDPIQLGRRRFEFELQALSTAVYDMDADVPLRSLPGGTAVALPQSVTDSAPPASDGSREPVTKPTSDAKPEPPRSAAKADRP
jgi:septal ring factor EnvC (AmiA/AmiB activator)